jgi:ribosome-binding factor A
MPTRRQAKVARVVKEVVSDAITNHLNDPRIRGFVSVTRVDVTPDLRNADVYLSVFPAGPSAQENADAAESTVNHSDLTFDAINGARNRIQSLLAKKIQTRFCPVISLHRDRQFKKTLDTMRLIDKVAGEFETKDAENTLESESSP